MKKILTILLMILIKLKQEKIKYLFRETVIYSLLYTEINKKEVIINLNVLHY
jgi:hypothetical protein